MEVEQELSRHAQSFHLGTEGNKDNEGYPTELTNLWFYSPLETIQQLNDGRFVACRRQGSWSVSLGFAVGRCASVEQQANDRRLAHLGCTMQSGEAASISRVRVCPVIQQEERLHETPSLDRIHQRSRSLR
jgi:hypothetical protein